MFPKIYDSLGKKIGILNTIESIKATENLSRKWILSLRTPIDDKSDLINASTTLDVDGQVFYPIRKKSARNSNGEAVYDINYEHISYIGNNEALAVDIFAHTGTSVDMFNHLMTLSGAPFTLGTFADTTTVATITINEKVSVRRVLEIIAETFNLEVEYDNLIVNMPTQIGNDKGFIFTENLNVEGVKVEEDYLENKTSIEIKGIELQNTEEAKSEILKALVDTKLGDVVNVKTEKFTGKTRIYEYSYNPLTGERFDSEWTLTSKLSNFTTANTKSKFQTVYKARPIYGVDINGDDGMEIERYDKFARSRFNAEEFRMQVGDGLGNYEDALYFNILENRYEFIGNVDVTGKLTAGEIIGGSITGTTINNGSGTFTVDELGNLLATSAEITGTITSSVINGSEINGTEINGGRYYNSFGDTYLDMGITQEIRFANATNDSGMFFDVQNGVNFSSLDSDNNIYNILSSALGETIANNIWEFTILPVYSGSQFATRSWVLNTAISGYSGTFGGMDIVTVSNGLVQSIS